MINEKIRNVLKQANLFINTNGLVIPNGKTITLTGGTLITENANFVISTSGNLTIQDMTITGTVEYLGGEMFTDKAFTVSATKMRALPKTQTVLLNVWQIPRCVLSPIPMTAVIL